MSGTRSILNKFNNTKKINQFEREFDKYINHLENDGYPDSDSLGQDQENEREYMRSHRDRFRYIFNMLPDDEDNLKLLDIGTTPFTILIKNIYNGYDVCTIDYSNLFKDRCKKKGIKFKKHDLTSGSIPFSKNEFDIIIFTEVLEHILIPPTILFEELYKIMRPGGQLIFGTPNFARLKNRIEVLRGVSPLQDFHPDSVHGHGHVREYTMKECLNILNDVGFDIAKREFINGKSPSHFIKRKSDIFGSNSYSGTVMITIYYALTMAMPSLRHFVYINAYK